MNTIKINEKKPLIVAHRGVSGIETENTVAAFIAAANRSYWAIETDVHVTSDGKFILIHDDTTKRVTGVDYRVEETDYETLRSLPVYDLHDGNKARSDLYLPNLAEYVRICKKYGKIGVLELKNPMTENQVFAIMDEIKAEDYLDGIVVIAFNEENLIAVRKYNPEQTVQLLFGNKLPEEKLDVARKHRFDIDVQYSVLTEELVRAFHDEGIRINCWTVDDPAAALQLASWGVDYITTNILE